MTYIVWRTTEMPELFLPEGGVVVVGGRWGKENLSSFPKRFQKNNKNKI